MPWIRRGLGWPGSEWLCVGSVLFVALALVHYDDLQRHWSSYHWEDQLFFEHNRAMIHSVRDCFVQPALWPGLYRPLTTNCYYYLGGWLFAHQIELYHTINVGLYYANALLVYWLVRTLLARAYALLAALLFASRAAHVEVITNTVEFQILAATFFTLLALVIWAAALRQPTHWRFLVAYLLLFCALLSKEASATAVLLLPLYAWFFAPAWRWSYLVGPLLVGAGWLALFTTALRLVNHDQATGFYFTVTPTLVLRNMTAHLWSFANWLAADPTNPVMPVRVEAMANGAGGQALLLLLVVVTVAVVVFKAYVPQQVWAVALGGAFFLVAILPYSFFEDRLFMRYGYTSHVGLTLATTALVALALSGIKAFWTRIALSQRLASQAGTPG